MEEKRKAETEQRLINESIAETQEEIANMTKEAAAIQVEAEGAKQQAADYLVAQTKNDELQVKKLAKQEIAEQKKLARLQQQLEENQNKT
jgi:ribosomal silencing factor RsfS